MLVDCDGRSSAIMKIASALESSSSLSRDCQRYFSLLLFSFISIFLSFSESLTSRCVCFYEGESLGVRFGWLGEAERDSCIPPRVVTVTGNPYRVGWKLTIFVYVLLLTFLFFQMVLYPGFFLLFYLFFFFVRVHVRSCLRTYAYQFLSTRVLTPVREYEPAFPYIATDAVPSPTFVPDEESAEGS